MWFISIEEKKKTFFKILRSMVMESKLIQTKMAAFLVLVTIVVMCAPAARAVDPNDMFDPTKILTFDINMSESTWDTIRTSCPTGWCGEAPHTYYNATLTSSGIGPIVIGIRRKSDPAEPNETDHKKSRSRSISIVMFPGKRFWAKRS